MRLVTFYGSPSKVAVYANDQMPAFAMVRRLVTPEYGQLLELEIATAFRTGEILATSNSPYAKLFPLSSTRFEIVSENPSIDVLIERHAERVAKACGNGVPLAHDRLESAMDLLSRRFAEIRATLRTKGWVKPTTNSHLDRFTFIGALMLTHHVNRVLRDSVQRRKLPASEQERLLRLEADLESALDVADHPESVPSSRSLLVTIFAVSVVASFVAMALLWNVFIAIALLAAIAIHEAGHAIVMRRTGYSDVRVFFVPLLGAITTGRPVATTVRNRVRALLAGPIPGLWFGLFLLFLDRMLGPVAELRAGAIVFLGLNGLNLLPFIPLDGGRALEALTRPESSWRPVVHVISCIGLLGVGLSFHDVFITALALGLALLLPNQILWHRVRREISVAIGDRGDLRSVTRVVLEKMATTRYASHRSHVRQSSARGLARAFSESLATSVDRRWGLIAYASAWLPILIAVILWRTGGLPRIIPS